jgi:hypothetical protein
VSAEFGRWLEAELAWAYRFIMGDTEDTPEAAGWRAFNGSKRLGDVSDGDDAG